MPIVADIMTCEVITVKPDTELRELAGLLQLHGINGVPVVDDQGRVMGVVCESDLVRRDQPLHIPTVFVMLDSLIPLENPWKLEKELKRLTATKVEDIYSSPAVTVTPETDVSEVARLMGDEKFYTIPVIKDGTLVGVVGKSDVIRSMYQ
ncbi:MAG: CBS domain-containing protein [Pseudomonadota bacterium]